MLGYADAAIRHALAALDGTVDEVRRSAEVRTQARSALHSDSSSFAALCANAGADGAAAELLALVVAVEVDPARAAQVAALDGSARGGRLTLGAAARLLGDVGRCAEAVGPDSALLRSALVDLVPDGTWASTRIRQGGGSVVVAAVCLARLRKLIS